MTSHRSVLFALAVLLVFAVARSARAEDGAPGAGASDLRGRRFGDLFDFTKGSIDVRDQNVAVQAGANDSGAFSGRGEAAVKYSTHGDSQTDAGVILDLRVGGTVDLQEGGRIENLNLYGPRLSLGADVRATREREDGSSQVWGTGSLRILPVSAEWVTNQPTGHERVGARMAFFGVGGHVSANVNGIPMDACVDVEFMTGVLGEIRHGESTSNEALAPVRGGACLGVSLGPVGHLRYSGYLDWMEDSAAARPGQEDGDRLSHVQLDQRLSLEKIGRTPVGVTLRHTKDWAIREEAEGSGYERNSASVTSVTAGFAF